MQRDFFIFYFKALYVAVCFGICVGQSSVFLLVHKWHYKTQSGRQHRQSTSNFYEAWDATAYRCSVWYRVTTQGHTEHLWLHVEKTWPLGDSI